MSQTAAAPEIPLAELARVRERLTAAIQSRIVGQPQAVAALLTALFARGHALFIGPPGVAKTLLVRTTAQALGWSFKRIQFTPDLMPADITGTEVLREVRETGERQLKFLPGPVFANLVLADEINRAPPKTQSALLEAMQERMVTAGGHGHHLPQPFAVLATQNPIEQEGTYRLPEAQLDRFLLGIQVPYPTLEEERRIATWDAEAAPAPEPVLDPVRFQALAAAIALLPVPPVAVDYAVRLARATRPGDKALPWVQECVAWGCGPRASQHLIAAARAFAALKGEPAATVEHIRAVAPLVLPHRLVPTFTAASRGQDGAALVQKLLGEVKP
jgi:MoxR-like ATPase